MKRGSLLLFSVALLSALLGVSAAQSVYVVGWTFESLPTGDLTSGSAYGPYTSDFSASAEWSGLATGFHSTSGTAWTSPAGNGSMHGLSANNWSVGDYYQFQVSTLGLHGLRVSWDQASSGTGPRDFALQYSLDGSTFTDVEQYEVLKNDFADPIHWNTVVAYSDWSHASDLGSIAALNDMSMLWLRLTNTSSASTMGQSVGAGGTGRIDNFRLDADNDSVSDVPEPGSMVLVGTSFALLALGTARRRRR